MARANQILEDTSQSMFSIGLVEHVAKLLKFSEQPQGRARYLEHDRRRMLWYADSCISLDAGKYGHLAEARARRQATYLALLAAVVLDPLRGAVRRYAIAGAAEDVRVVGGVLGERAEVLGALALVFAEGEGALPLRVGAGVSS